MSEIKSDVLIIGAGPSGIFTALELIRKNSDKTITIVEQGRNIDRRHCPKNKTGKCVNCKPYCNITTGFSGAGAFPTGNFRYRLKSAATFPSLSATTPCRNLSTTPTGFISISARIRKSRALTAKTLRSKKFVVAQSQQD